ncbi:hypothetical protein A3780_19110 [Kosakonia radicincitans]|nr:hypothetical protein A3780_19110 [Kosakonia radicincitans]
MYACLVNIRLQMLPSEIKKMRRQRIYVDATFVAQAGLMFADDLRVIARLQKQLRKTAFA